jgi:REP element-mobilizing transposase RayT
MDPHHRRRLPHVYPEGKSVFFTWHLHGSLPPSIYPPPQKENAGKAFVWMDRYLDAATTGPQYLRQEAVANLVTASIHHAARKLRYYDLQAFVVMPNHVHMMALPRIAPSRFMQTLKGYTAREANRLLNRTGQPFWQAESYDHWVRSFEEGERIRVYIENNPVRAALSGSAEEYRWSSAHPAQKAEMNLGSAG